MYLTGAAVVPTFGLDDADRWSTEAFNDAMIKDEVRNRSGPNLHSPSTSSTNQNAQLPAHHVKAYLLEISFL